MKNEVTFAELTIEARTEVIKEAAEETSWAIEKTEEKMARLVELLLQQRQAVGHGGWLPWIRETFGDTDASVWKVQRWLRNDRSNNARRIICDDMPEADIAPRSERKTGVVEVVEPGQPSVQPDGDTAPAPPTNRKTSKANRKAKEADRPKTAAITPELFEGDQYDLRDVRPISDAEAQECAFGWIGSQSLPSVLDVWFGETEPPKKRAKALRKQADQYDPPTKFVKPDLDDCKSFFVELNAAEHAESFFDFYESKGWIVGKVSMKDWKASARKWAREQAANPFGGNGKASGNGSDNGPKVHDDGKGNKYTFGRNGQKIWQVRTANANQ